MKIKSLTLLLALSFLTNISFAQYAGSYKLTKSNSVSVKHKNPNYQKPKFYIMPEIGAGISLDREDMAIIVDLELGCEFNKFFSLGCGIGYIGITGEKNESTSFITPYMSSMPVYLNMHGSFSKKNVSPYWSIDLGFNFPINDYKYSRRFSCEGNCYKENCYKRYHQCIYGLMISPELGLRLGSCSYLGINALMMGRKDYVSADHDYSCYYKDSSSKSWGIREWALSLKFGYKIMSHK